MVTADEARRIRVRKGSVNHETYKGIYETISKRITAAAQRGETSIEYRIPPLVPGRPIYDIKHAIRYNHDKLRHAGFAVDTHDDLLKIDWKPPPPPPKKDKKHPTEPKPKPKPKTTTTKTTTKLSTDFKSSSAISQKLLDLKKKLKW
jgi:hypothetical protein